MATDTRSKQKVHELAIKLIHRDVELQPRTRIDQETVHRYSEAMLNGDVFPEIVVFFDGETYYLADGFHRMAAAEKVGDISIRATVFQGSKDDAFLYSAGANATHGVLRGPVDTRMAVLKVLSHPIFSQWTNAEIAKRCKVSATTVSRYRDLNPGLPGYDTTARIKGNGEIYEVPTVGGAPKNGAAPAPSSQSSSPEAIAPERKWEIPLRQMDKKQIVQTYQHAIFRYVKKLHSSAELDVETEFGMAHIVDRRRVYVLATVRERRELFEAVGRTLLIARRLGEDLLPVVVAPIPRLVRELAESANELGILVITPSVLLNDLKKEVRDA